MSDWIPSLNSIRAFEAVARHLSYKSAAEELRVTPAAVKQLVSKLEESLDVTLFERKGHSLTLTPVGLASKNDMSLAMGYIRDGVDKMRRDVRDTRILVTVEASLATTWLVSKLENFRAAHPGINVLIDSSQHITDLKNSDVDVAIRYGVRREHGFIAHRLFEDLVAVACSPSLANGPPILKNLDQLRDIPLIHWDLSQMPWAKNTRRWFEWDNALQHLGVSGVDTTKGIWFSDYGLAVQAAASNQGMLLAGLPVMRETFAAGLLVCPFENSILTTDIGFDVVASKQSYSKPAVANFVNWLIDIARKEHLSDAHLNKLRK